MQKMCTHILASIIHFSQKGETTQMSVSGPKDKHSMLSPYNRILLLSH